MAAGTGWSGHSGASENNLVGSPRLGVEATGAHHPRRLALRERHARRRRSPDPSHSPPSADLPYGAPNARHYKAATPFHLHHS
jgi:hypothetical protein